MTKCNIWQLFDSSEMTPFK